MTLPLKIVLKSEIRVKGSPFVTESYSESTGSVSPVDERLQTP